MFKKSVVIVMVVMLMVVALAAPAYAMCASEDGRPCGIVNVELAQKFQQMVNDFNEIEDEPVDVDYLGEFLTWHGYWVVALEGRGVYEGYGALGVYEQYPTEQDLTVLWANRLTIDEIDEIVELYELDVHLG